MAKKSGAAVAGVNVTSGQGAAKFWRANLIKVFAFITNQAPTISIDKWGGITEVRRALYVLKHCSIGFYDFLG